MALNTLHNVPYNQVEGLDKRLYFPQKKEPYWHAHSEWWRATVHGAIIIHPKKGTKYPFPLPHAEVPIIFGIIKLAFSMIGTFFFVFQI